MPTARWPVQLELTLLLATAALPSLGQDLLQIWQMAQQRDPIYAASRAGRVADQEIVPQARAQLLPYISADAVAEVDDARRLQGLNESARERRALWALTLVQPLFDASAWGGLKRAEFIAKSADIDQARAYQDLILRVDRKSTRLNSSH